MQVKGYFLKSFLNDLDKQLNHSEKYRSFYQSLADVLADYDQKQTLMKKALDLSYEKSKTDTLAINQHFLDKSTKINNRFRKDSASNQLDLENAQIIIDKQIRVAQADYKSLQDSHAKELKEIDAIYLNKIDDATAIYTQEIALENKTKPVIRRKYRLQTNQIEADEQKQLKTLNAFYEQNSKALEIASYDAKVVYQTALGELTNEYQSYVLSYDRKKNDFKGFQTTNSIAFNTHINQIKRKESLKIDVLKKVFNDIQTPIYEDIGQADTVHVKKQQAIKDSYQKKKNKILTAYTKKESTYQKLKTDLINQMNLALKSVEKELFEYQNNYLSKHSRFIISSNQSIQDKPDLKEKKLLVKEKKTAIQAEKDLYKQEIKKYLSNLDAIKQNAQLEIFRLEKDFLIESKAYKLQEIDLEMELDHALNDLDLQYKIELSTLHTKIEKEKIIFDHKLKNHTLNQMKSLLPIESQVLIQSAAYNLELNLISNDIEIEKATTQYELIKLKKQYEIACLERDLEQAILDFKYQKDVKNVKINAQLHIEIERIIRDYNLEEIEYRKRLQKEVFNMEKQLSAFDKSVKTLEVEFKIELARANHNFSIESFKQVGLFEFTKNQFGDNEAKTKYQEALNINKTERILNSYLVELSKNQHQVNTLFIHIFDMLSHIWKTNVLYQAFILEHSEEDLSSMILLFTTFVSDYMNDISSQLDFFSDLDKTYYDKKIEETVGYKYTLKHGELLSLYDQIHEKVAIEKEQLSKRIQNLENELFLTQARVEKSKSQLFDERLNLMNLRRKNEQVHNKEHQFNIKTYEKEMQQSSKQVALIEKQIFKFNRQITLIEQREKEINLEQHQKLKSLQNDKKKEGSFFYDFLEQNILLHKNLRWTLNGYINTLKTDLNHLVKTPKLPLHERRKLFKIQEMTHKKSLKSIHHLHQLFLSHYLKVYQLSKNEQNQIIHNFISSSKAMSKNITDTFNSHKFEYERQFNTRNSQHKAFTSRLSNTLNHSLQAQKLALDMYNQNHTNLINKINKMIEKNHFDKRQETENHRLNEQLVKHSNEVDFIVNEHKKTTEIKKQTKMISMLLSNEKDSFTSTLEALKFRGHKLSKINAEQNEDYREHLKMKTEEYNQEIRNSNITTKNALLQLDYSLKEDEKRYARLQEKNKSNNKKKQKNIIKNNTLLLNQAMKRLKKANHFMLK